MVLKGTDATRVASGFIKRDLSIGISTLDSWWEVPPPRNNEVDLVSRTIDRSYGPIFCPDASMRAVAEVPVPLEKGVPAMDKETMYRCVETEKGPWVKGRNSSFKLRCGPSPWPDSPYDN